MCRAVRFVCCMLPVLVPVSVRWPQAAGRRVHCTSSNLETTVACQVQPIQAHNGTALAAASVADSVQPYAGGTNIFPCPPPPLSAVPPKENSAVPTLENPHIEHSDARTLCNGLLMGTQANPRPSSLLAG